MRSLRPSPRRPPLRSVTDKGKRLVLPRLDVPSAFLALLLCFSAALPAVAQEPPRRRDRPDERRPRPAHRRARRSGRRPPRPDANKRHHALSLIGEPKYPAGFTHFDWVNPDAPKGGTHPRLRRGLVRQPQPVHGEGRPRRRHRPGLRLADGLAAPTSRRPNTASSPSGSPIRPTFVGDLRPQSARRASTTARRSRRRT